MVWGRGDDGGFHGLTFSFGEALLQDDSIFSAGEVSFLFAVNNHSIRQAVVSEVVLMFTQACVQSTSGLAVIRCVAPSTWDLVDDTGRQCVFWSFHLDHVGDFGSSGGGKGVNNKIKVAWAPAFKRRGLRAPVRDPPRV